MQHKQPLHTLQPGQTYWDGRYIVRDNDGNSIGVRRLEDGICMRFYKGTSNWDWMVEVSK